MIEGALWKILAFILAVILMFGAPMMVMYDRQEAVTYSVAFSAVNEMTAITRELGVIDRNHYKKLADTLGATGLNYDIMIEHYRKVYVPVYDAAGNFTGSSYVSYEGVFNSDVVDVLEVAGDYKMTTGDLLFVQVENTTPTPAQTLRQMFLGGQRDGSRIVVRSGGMVHSESD